MKKAIALVMAACLAFGLVACGGASSSTATSTSTASSAASTSEAASSEAASSEAASSEAAATEAGVKTGMAIVSDTSSTKSADADGDGLAQVDSTVAAVLVGEDGKIISCKLDVAQNKIPVTAEGTFDTTLTFQSVMKKNGGITATRIVPSQHRTLNQPFSIITKGRAISFGNCPPFMA